MLEQPPSSANNDQTGQVLVAAGALMLPAILSIPDNARGIVVLAQGSRNIESNVPIDIFADVLEGAGLATLTVHLLTDDEEELDRATQFFRFNVSILHQRIIGIANWLLENPATRNLTIGYFGTSITGAAALIAAAERPDPVHAIVAVNARTELAQEYLSRVLEPTFLIVGENDSATVNINRQALKQIPAEVEANKRIEIISGTTGLFETPEMVNKVAELASQWFQRHLEPIV